MHRAHRLFKFRIESGQVFDNLLVFMTRDMPAVLRNVLGGGEAAAATSAEDYAALKARP